MRTNIAADEAVRLLLDQPVHNRTETVPLWELEGRVLAEDIFAAIPVPPFDRSPYDGYALMGEDTAAATPESPVVLKITEEIPAGRAPSLPVTHGFAAKILTGAPMPEGANVTVKYEHTRFTDTEVSILHPLQPNTDIVRTGEDIQAGELILKKGSLVTSAALGMLAGQGIAQASVWEKPRIAVISTGSELAEPGQTLAPAQIYNSNVYTIASYLRAMGAEPVNGGIVIDDPDQIASRIANALADSDMVITTGGASVGDYDWALRVSQQLGGEILFWNADFKPGGAMSVAMLKGKMILSLSGSPGAAVIGLLRVGMPYIKKLCGFADVMPESFTAILKRCFKKTSPKLRMVRGRLITENGVAYFDPNDGQGNGVISSLMGCDLLGEIPPGTGTLDAGVEIKVYRVPTR